MPENYVISQSPPAGVELPYGAYVNIHVSDGAWTGEDITPPRVAVTADPGLIQLGQSVTLTVSASDDVGVTSMSLSVNGDPVTLIGNVAQYTPADQGTFAVEARASDAAGHISIATTSFRTRDPDDAVPPVVSIDSPTDGGRITAPVDFMGTVSDPGLDHYVLEYSRAGQNDWQVVHTGHEETSSGNLGRFDPTLLKNGIYDVRLTAVDLNGNTAFVELTAIVDGQLKAGVNKIAFTDLQVPVCGLDITINRAYDSSDKQPKEFGVGWSIAVHDVNLDESRVPGADWYEINTGSFLPNWEIRADRPHVVVVTYPDGRTDIFDIQAQYVDPVYRSGREVILTFVPRDRTTAALVPMANALVAFDYGTLIDMDTLNVFDPDRYRLTTRDGLILDINQNTGLEKMVDPSGNTLTIDANGISHSSGKSITMVKDGEGRITQITDPNGHTLLYAYDAQGDQVSFTDREGRVSTYSYDDKHNLMEIVDPRGKPALRAEYDENGRLVATRDALGNRIDIDHDLDSFTSVVTDRRGFAVTYLYDEEGNILSQTDPYGHTTTYTYDAHGNQLTETNPLGQTTTRTYDEWDNELSETDPLGNTVSYTYNDNNRLLTQTNPMGRTTTHTYDAAGNLLTTEDAMGHVTTNTYDSRGNLLTTEDAMGQVTSYTYDAHGNQLTRTDPAGVVYTYTYDENGNPLTESFTRTTDAGPVTSTTTSVYNNAGQAVKVTDPDGYFTETQYNLIGKRSVSIDKRGFTTTYAYDDTGQLISTSYPDGTSEISAYDAAGNRISSTDRGGRTTSYIYDGNGRNVGTIHADGSSTSMDYDAAGRISVTYDERGAPTSNTYDAAGRRQATYNAFGHAMFYGYNAAGNMTSVTDANGHVTSYEYDELGRRTATVFADGSSTTTGYDALGRKTGETDQAGRTTLFGYDELGRLTSVTDARGGVTSFTYNEAGDRLTQTDANGHTTSWGYDIIGRTVRRTLPLGMYETFRYDAAGNQTSRIDFNGHATTYDYDSNNRLTAKHYPDGTSVGFTYTAIGHRDTVTDSRGMTSYAYDSRDRLIEVEHPGGTMLVYTYDQAGNRTSITAPNGTTTFSYDQLNRLATVVDPDSGQTTYAYDNVGNRAAVTYPNGTYAQYTYDSLNRLTKLDNKKADGSTISRYNYTLGPAGNRVAVTEYTGRTVNYTYDELFRLITEEILDPNDGDQTITYTYDSFGNRLTKIDNSGTTTYTYDDNDRLLTENSPVGLTTYIYDNNGNTIRKDSPSEAVDHTYDYENRLINTSTLNDNIDCAYDADGIRVSKNVNGLVIDFVVDKNRQYAQVLEEYENGSFTTEYIHGDDLISQTRGTTTSYYHYDGQLSSRQLTDTSAVTTDEYKYDAFGNLINQTGSTQNNYLYTGEQYDQNVGFYYLRARYYNLNNGRFINSDTWAGSNSDPISLHKYLYCHANPVNGFDSSGHWFNPFSFDLVCKQIIIATEISAGLTAMDQFMAITRSWLNTGEYTYWSGDVIFCGFFEIMLLSADLQSNIIFGKKGRPTVHVEAFFFGFSLPSPTTLITYHDVIFETPERSIASDNYSEDFTGLASFVSFSIVPQFYNIISISSIILGNAHSKGIDYLDSESTDGIDIGADAMFGFSWTCNK